MILDGAAVNNGHFALQFYKQLLNCKSDHAFIFVQSYFFHAPSQDIKTLQKWEVMGITISPYNTASRVAL